jgi:hypothetical protein
VACGKRSSSFRSGEYRNETAWIAWIMDSVELAEIFRSLDLLVLPIAIGMGQAKRTEK